MILLTGFFWITMVSLLFIIVFGATVEKERGFLATLSVVVYVLLLQFLFKVDVLSFVIENPLRTVALVVGYFGVGVLYSYYRFCRFYRRTIESWVALGRTNWFNRNRKSFVVRDATTMANDVVTEDPSTWTEDLKESWNQYVEENAPSYSDYKGKILNWMCGWVVSLPWFLMSDFVSDIFNVLYERVVKFYARAAQRMKNAVKM